MKISVLKNLLCGQELISFGWTDYLTMYIKIFMVEYEFMGDNLAAYKFFELAF